jgi:hypothetical protein
VKIGDVVRIQAPVLGMPNKRAEIAAEDRARPQLVKVIYLHSRTAAWVARSRVIAPKR